MTNTNWYYTLAVFVVLSAVSALLAGEISGTIYDSETGLSISAVNIDIVGKPSGAASDAAGKFLIENLTEGKYNLTVSAVGYERKTLKAIEVPEDGEVELDISLMPVAISGEEIVITSTRRAMPLKDVPDIVLNIPRDQIERIQPHSIGEIILYSPGVSIESGTGSGQPNDEIVSIDGLPAHYSIIMMDGARVLSSHYHTGASVNIIPPEAIERIEVLKGASSAQYGSDGIGGAVNIITKRGGSEPQMLFTAYGGDRRTQFYSLSLSGTIKSNVMFSSFTSFIKTDGDSILLPAHRLGQLDYEKLTLLQSIDADLCENLSTKTQLFYMTSNSTFRSQKQDSWLVTPKIELEYRPTDEIDIRLSANYSQWNSEINIEKNEIAQPQIIFGYNGVRNNYILLGSEWTYRNFRRTAVDEHDQSAIGIFLQDEWDFSEKLSVLSALRFDKVENNVGVITPKLSIKFNPIWPINLRLSVGRGFRAPTVQDLYEGSYGHGAYKREGNPDLQPEFATGITGGMEIHPVPELSILLDGYYTSLTDMITPVFDHSEVIDSVNIAIYIRQNIHSATIYGGGIRLAYNFFHSFELESSFNITHNENRETGTSLPYYPGMTFSTKLSGKESIISWLEIGGHLGLNLVSGRRIWNWNEIAEEQELDDYKKLDAGLNLTFGGRYELFSSIENILGEEIVTYEDAFMRLAGIPHTRFGLRIKVF